MKVFMLHVGNALENVTGANDGQYLLRKGFLDGKEHVFYKSDIINADTQMISIIKKGIKIDYGHLFERRSIRALWQAGMKIRSVSKAEDIDLIHVMWGTATALATVVFSKKPVVISFSGSDLLGIKDKNGKITVAGRVNRFLSRVASIFASAVITKSAEMKSTLSMRVAPKTFVIPNGVDLNIFHPMDMYTARKELKIFHNRPIVLFFYSKGGWVKDFKLASATFELIKKEIPFAELLVAEGIQHELLVYYYNSCNLMLLTSFHEGSNNSLKEARACNLPIVSVDVGDACERLENVSYSFVVRERKAEILAEKAIAIIKSGRKSNGYDLSGEISLESVSENIIDVYRFALQKRKRGHLIYT